MSKPLSTVEEDLASLRKKHGCDYEYMGDDGTGNRIYQKSGPIERHNLEELARGYGLNGWHIENLKAGVPVKINYTNKSMLLQYTDGVLDAQEVPRDFGKGDVRRVKSCIEL
jgi:hypothetical protein